MKVAKTVLTSPGSPPRAWGAVAAKEGLPLRERFTPTGVGSSHRRHAGAALPPVHPHGRGEQ